MPNHTAPRASVDPQLRVQMSESGGSGADMNRRTGSPPAAPASLPDDDDLLWEILLRLPPHPSSLPRASAVCRQWRRLATDPKFLRRFREHHRMPPVLGVFEYRDKAMVFTSVLDPPDRIRPERFDLGRYSGCRDHDLLCCRHGRVLISDRVHGVIVVCAPITGEQRRVAIPPEFKMGPRNGEVLCAAGDPGHVHGECHSGPFKVVLMSMTREDRRPITRVYSSETGLWGSLISTARSFSGPHGYGRAGIPVGNALYWLLGDAMWDSIVEFDLEKQSLVLIDGPPIDVCCAGCQIIQAEDGALGFACLSYPSFQMWQRNVNAHGVATWVLWKTIEMHNILGLPPQIQRPRREVVTVLGLDYAEVMGVILSYVEDADVVFIFVDVNVYMVQLNPMQSKRLHETEFIFDNYPFTSFYTPDGGTAAAVLAGSVGIASKCLAEFISYLPNLLNVC